MGTIFPWISTKKSVDVDMDGKFHIHGKPGDFARFCAPDPTPIPT